MSRVGSAVLKGRTRFFLTSLIEISLNPFFAVCHHLGTMAFKKQRTTLSTDGESIRQHDDPLDDPPAEIMKPPFTAFKDVEVVANLTKPRGCQQRCLQAVGAREGPRGRAGGRFDIRGDRGDTCAQCCPFFP